MPICHLYELQEGDYINTTEDIFTGGIIKGAEHAIIRTATWSEWSHPMIYMGANRIVEAVMPVVHLTNINMALQNTAYAAAWTLDSMTGTQRKKVTEAAMGLLKAHYDVSAALLSPVEAFVAGDSPRCFCSGIVVDCYLQAGITLVKGKAGAAYPGKLSDEKYLAVPMRWLGWLKNPWLQNKCDPQLYRQND